MTNDVANVTYKIAIQVMRATLKKFLHNGEVQDYVLDALSEAKIYNFADVWLRAKQKHGRLHNKMLQDMATSNNSHSYEETLKAMMGFTATGDVGYEGDSVFYNIPKRYLPDFPVFLIHPAYSDIYKGEAIYGIMSWEFLLPMSEGRYIRYRGLSDIRKNVGEFLDVVRITDEPNSSYLKLEFVGEIGKKWADTLRNSDDNTISQVTTIITVTGVDIYTIADTFEALTDQTRKTFKVYEDEPQSNKTIAYINRATKDTLKIAEKPVFLILKDDEDLQNNMTKYRRKGGNIHYCFSWIVRGHWRKLHNPETMGYGMTGERTQGKTYIKSYVKGDVNAPLIKRETVIIDRRKHA